MFKFSYIAILAFFVTTPLFSEDKSYENLYVVEHFECLNYRGFNRHENSFQFRNECSERVDAYICVEYSDGEKELRRSRRAIPKGGNWKISSDWGRTPKNVHWSSSQFEPEIPEPCR